MVRPFISIFREAGRLLVMLAAVLRSRLAVTGGEWAAGILTLVFMLIFTHGFLVPGTRMVPFPVLHLEYMALVVSVLAVSRVPGLPAGFLQPQLWFWAALVVAVIVARIVSARLAVGPFP